MDWFKRKKRTSGNQEIRNWDIGKSGDQETDRIPGSPDNRIPGTVRSRGLFRLATPVLLALFTAFLMIHTAAVLSSPQSFITGGGGSSLLS
ncbi:MAG: hypothetical protein UY82_C0023G0003 [Candidatus Uhrbacteria bacterium GW2011_GWC2_53_7]|uniref:Uncharacterized protein n=1 Tax=Candidatus Uhrbacteria bacterium GW2011_GWC2_53_7 TaxID=1618986 RepID=A0A0G2AUC8_9BACT|nr:MAG: hypothetical protein UY82_C0023G0003 [Candidatus Uhrbacteria bacterium GW2011_GWC2_53_7]